MNGHWALRCSSELIWVCLPESLNQSPSISRIHTFSQKDSRSDSSLLYFQDQNQHCSQSKLARCAPACLSSCAWKIFRITTDRSFVHCFNVVRPSSMNAFKFLTIAGPIRASFSSQHSRTPNTKTNHILYRTMNGKDFCATWLISIEQQMTMYVVPW